MMHWLCERFRSDQSLGMRGERLAERFLKRSGMKIVARQYRIAVGEIDLVAVDDRTVVFVEVKTRDSDQKGEPWEAVNRDKQKTISTVALDFLRRHDLLENQYRFDIVSIVWPANSRNPQVEHLENAFVPEDRGQFFS